MIHVKNLTFYYPNQTALKNISFDIPPNSITALVGPNGAGKTTLLKCLAGVTQPHDGSIFLDNTNVIENPREAHQKLGFLLDFFGLYDELTVEQCLTFAGLSHEIPPSKIKEAVLDTARKINLENKLKENAKSLSRGMRQRLAIGQTIIHKPKILFLDEPASGLDPEARIALAELFLSLKNEGISLIVSSHILAELDAYADNLLILKNGEIINHSISTKKVHQEIIVSCLEIPSNIGNILNHQLIDSFEEKNNVLFLQINGQEKEQAELLKYLIENDIQVTSFHTKKISIQDQYLDSVKK